MEYCSSECTYLRRMAVFGILSSKQVFMWTLWSFPLCRIIYVPWRQFILYTALLYSALSWIKIASLLTNDKKTYSLHIEQNPTSIAYLFLSLNFPFLFQWQYFYYKYNKWHIIDEQELWKNLCEITFFKVI